MAKIYKALIIRRLENEISMEYAEGCAKSCEEHGLPYEFIDAVEHVDCETAFKSVGAFKTPKYSNTQGNCCCHSSHIKCWKRIIELDKPCLILEHDAIVKGNVQTLDIPDMAVTTFGHRVANRDDYSPVKPAERFKKIPRAIGVHACGLTPKTAQWLWDDARIQGIHIGIDKYLLMQRKSGLPLYVCEPEQVVCWARVSTSNLQRSKKFRHNPRPSVRNFPEGFSDYWLKGMKKK